MELRVEKNITLIVTSVLAIVAVVAIAYAGYRYYTNSLSAQAHDIFMQRYQEFEKLAEKSENSAQLAEKVATDYNDYKRSAYAPFFLALQSELSQLQGDKEKALDLMDKAMADMSSADRFLYYLYATKHALMQLDVSELATQTKGRQALEKLAMNTKNPMRDMAWFYLGYQAYCDHDDNGVQVAWSKLFDANKNPISPWGYRAQSLLSFTA